MNISVYMARYAEVISQIRYFQGPLLLTWINFKPNMDK